MLSGSTDDHDSHRLRDARAVLRGLRAGAGLRARQPHRHRGRHRRLRAARGTRSRSTSIPRRRPSSVFGGLIASGWHTGAMWMRLYVDSMLGGAASMGSPGIEELRWLAPVRPGDTLRGRLTVLEATPSERRPDRGTVRIRGRDGQPGRRHRASRWSPAATSRRRRDRGCCARHGQEQFFGERSAARDARRYRRKGADPMARSLARRASARGIGGRRWPRSAAASGQVLLELVQAGAARGEVVELVPVLRAAPARRSARDAGVADRVSFRTADLVADPAAGEAADVVVLNKVVCCTPDGVTLAGIAASLARSDARAAAIRARRGWVRAGFATIELSSSGCARRRSRGSTSTPARQLVDAADRAGGTRPRVRTKRPRVPDRRFRPRRHPASRLSV